MRSSPRQLDPSSNMGIAGRNGRFSIRCAASLAGLGARGPSSFKRLFSAFWNARDFLELLIRRSKVRLLHGPLPLEVRSPAPRYAVRRLRTVTREEQAIACPGKLTHREIDHHPTDIEIACRCRDGDGRCLRRGDHAHDTVG